MKSSRKCADPSRKMKRQQSCWTIVREPRSTSVKRKLSRSVPLAELLELKALRILSCGPASVLQKTSVTIHNV